MKTRPTKTEIENWFKKLERHLADVELSTSTGSQRSVTASEFMLMAIGEDGTAQFKHVYTKNYVFVVGDQLQVPITKQPFLRGFFDQPTGPVVVV